MCVTGEIEREKGHFVFFYYIIFDTSRYVSSSVGFKCLKSIFDEGRKELYIIPLSSNWILYFPDGIEIFPFAWIFKLGYFSTCCIYYTFTPTTIPYKRIFAGKERSYLRSLFKSIELSFQRRKNLFVGLFSKEIWFQFTLLDHVIIAIILYFPVFYYTLFGEERIRNEGKLRFQLCLTVVLSANKNRKYLLAVRKS